MSAEQLLQSASSSELTLRGAAMIAAMAAAFEMSLPAVASSEERR